jgi:hypothetical protein
MKRYLSGEPVCCLWRMALAAVFLLFTLGAARGATGRAAGAGLGLDHPSRGLMAHTVEAANYPLCKPGDTRPPLALRRPADLEIGDTAGWETCATAADLGIAPGTPANGFQWLIQQTTSLQ